jgi:enoyl-CoA hydratase/carnithine racemase
MGDLITYNVADLVATITINRPEVRNAINYEAAEELAATLTRFDGDDEARVGILVGQGGVFSAGMDLKAVSAGGRRPLTDSRGAFGICERPPGKPMIAAVERFALGGGLEIALACDLIVVSSDASLGLPEVRRGQVAAAGGLVRLPRRMPTAVATELALTGDLISPERALALGLVNRVSAPGDTLAEATEIALRIAANAPLATRAAKRLINESADWPMADAFERQQVIVQPVRESQDAREGALAFVEKRQPVWLER